MSSFSIESAGQWLGQLLIQEVQWLSEVKDKVEELQSELEWMQCFLLDADGRRNKNALIRKWVSEISDLALQAEDHTEMYILKVSNKRQDGFINGLKWLACFWMDAITLHTVGSQIDALTSKISKLSSRLQTYGVQSSFDATTKKLIAEQRRTYADDQPDYIVGLEQDVTQLIHQLKNGSHKIMVAHGMGGIGKTVLAREVYQNCLSQGHFVGCAWAYVSQECKLEAVCKELLYELIPKEDHERRLMKLQMSEMAAELCEILKSNNYLVVLDDVWTSKDWKQLERAFSIHDTSFNSRILVTTRNPQIFSKLGDDLVSTWTVETLKEESCWRLLENKAHFKKNELDSSMQKVAEKMLDHCNGHPLAIVALGGVLATKKSLEEWESVSENLQYYLQGEDEESYSGVYDVLAMSYYDLHYNLKPCFLHMGHFPEDARIDVEKVYNLWIADGIVSSTQNQSRQKRSLEQVADSYLNQLVQKGMIQVDDKKNADGRIITCRLHDLMRDKCLEMIKEESFLQIINNTDKNKKEALSDSRADNNKARRLTVYVGKEDGHRSILDSLSGKMASLRSLMFISTCPLEERKEESCEWVITICKRFKLLRILDFEGGVILRGTLPSQVGNLIYLRHLSLRGTRITALPASIKNLKSLLILDLRVSNVVIKLPNVLWELSALCYLYFPARHLSQEAHMAPATQGYEIEDGSQLILDKLSHLERIDDVNLDDVDVKGLLHLTSMKKLSATCRRHRASLVPFLKSPSIKHLNLKVDANILKGDSNSMLLSQSSSLRTLHIDAKRFPKTYLTIQVEMFPCNLVELGFWYCLLEDDPMPILEKLPKLRRLQLRICYQGRKMECSENAFPELVSLALDGLFSLQVWNVQKGGFPKLQELELYNTRLLQIPNALPPKLRFHCEEKDLPLVDKFREQAKASAST